LENKIFKLFVSIFAVALVSIIYLAIVIPMELYFGHADLTVNGDADIAMRLVAGTFGVIVMWISFSKIEKFTEQILGKTKNNLQKGGGLEENSLQD